MTSDYDTEFPDVQYTTQPSQQSTNYDEEFPDIPEYIPRYSRVRVSQITHHGTCILAVLEDTQASRKRKRNDDMEDCIDGTAVEIRLEDMWRDMKIERGTILHLIPAHSPDKPYVLSAASDNLLIIHPDTLVSATLIAESFSCVRKAIINSRYKSSQESNKALIYGAITHQIFQKGLQNAPVSDENLHVWIKNAIANNIEQLYAVGSTVESAQDDLLRATKAFPAWYDTYMGAKPKEEANLQSTKVEAKQILAIKDIRDIEENIWSFVYGLKGKIDATLWTVAEGKGTQVEGLQPFELKTGGDGSLVSHSAQLILYTLMLSDKYECPIDSGLLFYSSKSIIYTIPSNPVTVKWLILKRNELSRYFKDISALPPTLSNLSPCQRCYRLATCGLLLRKSLPSDRRGISESKTDPVYISEHIDDASAAFFHHWNDLLTWEEIDSSKGRDREENHTNTSLRLLSVGINTAAQSDFVRFRIEFAGDYSGSPGDYISVSTLQFRGLATAVILSKENGVLAIGTDRNIWKEDYYMFEKYESTAALALARSNMNKLMTEAAFVKQRSLIIGCIKPTFTQAVPPIYLAILDKLTLNEDQRNALERTLLANDYAIIRGMPGTGKTTTIVALIQCLVQANKSVLLTSYTHSAVDNILLKIMKLDIPFLRLGSTEKIHSDLQNFIPCYKNTADVEQSWMRSQVVATSCLGVSHMIFSKRKFDYCIIDEASQVTLPSSIGPLLYADKFILVGDDHQLPPLVRSKEALAKGLSVSLFELLGSHHPEIISILGLQYRMNADIMQVCNDLVYNGTLRCGTEEIARSQIDLAPGLTGWLSRACDPLHGVAFLSTDLIGAIESKIDDNLINRKECELVRAIVLGLQSHGILGENIGIITPYRAQCKLIRKHLPTAAQVEVNTIDKYQGRDKDVILISLVRSNEALEVGFLLSDWRRLNVAFSRAKKKLFVIGDISTLAADPLLSKFISLMKRKGWVNFLYWFNVNAYSNK